MEYNTIYLYIFLYDGQSKSLNVLLWTNMVEIMMLRGSEKLASWQEIRTDSQD